MPALTTTDQLLELVRKSRLVDDARLDRYLQSAESLPSEPRAVARLLIQNGLLTSFQASQLLVGKWRGFLVANGKYKLLELLGIGGMGKVYLCEHVRMKRLVALKVLPTEKLEEPSSLERFEREARASGALDHPNIVRAHDLDSDQDGKLHFLVMEYVDGSSLHEIVKKHGPMEIARACHYIGQAATGLQHAHECAGLVHRDVKPGNILLDRTGTVKLLDMGLARFFYDDSSNPLTKRFEKNAVLGTADYLAPEQADSSDVDIRADIYGLGSTFYFLLTGKPPFDHGTITEKIMSHQVKAPEPIRNLRPDVPEELAAVIAKMMAKKPVQRYQEPAAVVEALQPWTAAPIEPPADEEMPRLCPALETYGLAGLPGPPSGTGGLSGRLRGGPRSTAINRRSTARMPRLASTTNSARLIGVGFGFAALLGAIAGLIWYVSQPPVNSRIGPRVPEQVKRQPSSLSAHPAFAALPPVAANTLYVTTDDKIKVWATGREDVLNSLGEALAKAGPNFKVVALGPTVDGQLRIDGAILPGITIEGRSADGQPVVWKASEGAPADQPLLTLNNAGAAHIRGIVFDGAKRVDTLIRVQGDATGMRLEDCYLTDALKTSLVVADATAAKDRPLTIERVRFTSVRDYRNDRAARPAAIWCLNDWWPPAGPLALAVRLCRIEGSFQAGVRLEFQIDADLRLNRFLSTLEGPADAVSIRIFPEPRALQLTLASNTAAGCANLLRLDRLPSKTSGSTFMLRSNLMVDGDAFVQAGEGADLTTAKLLFAGGSGNVAKAEHCNGGLPVLEKVKAGSVLVGMDPANDRTFLRYGRQESDSHELYTAGAGGEPAGVPPVE